MNLPNCNRRGEAIRPGYFDCSSNRLNHPEPGIVAAHTCSICIYANRPDVEDLPPLPIPSRGFGDTIAKATQLLGLTPLRRLQAAYGMAQQALSLSTAGRGDGWPMNSCLRPSQDSGQRQPFLDNRPGTTGNFCRQFAMAAKPGIIDSSCNPGRTDTDGSVLALNFQHRALR
jgi:hypothetical protein